MTSIEALMPAVGWHGKAALVGFLLTRYATMAAMYHNRELA